LLLLAGVLLLWLSSEVIPWAVGAVLLAVLYPFTKRWLYYPQFFLGLAFAWAVPMAFVSILGTMPAAGWWLFAITVLWALIYDSWYALVDREDDLRVGIKSTAIWFGDKFFAIMLLLMLLFVWLVYALGQAFDLGMVWWFVCAAIALDFAWQWWRVYHDHTLAFWAFRHNVWIGVVLWVGIWVSLSLR
jgi:4-hydroxybenzoate polyprenyltransferase